MDRPPPERQVQIALRSRLYETALARVLEAHGFTVDRSELTFDLRDEPDGPGISDDRLRQAAEVLVTDGHLPAATGTTHSVAAPANTDRSRPRVVGLRAKVPHAARSGDPSFRTEVVLTTDASIRDLIVVIQGLLEKPDDAARWRPTRRSRQAVPRTGTADDGALTDREQMVLALLARGLGTVAISQELGMSPNTVRSHIHKVLMKMGVGSRREAVLAALGRDAEPALAPTSRGSDPAGLASATPMSNDDDPTDQRSQKVIRVLIGVADRLFREVIRDGLDMEPDIEVVGEAGNGQHVVDESGRIRPDVVLLDFDIQSCDVPRTARMIQECNPGCHTLVLVGRNDVSVLVEGLRGGGSGCYMKDGPFFGLVQTVNAVARGELAVPRAMLRDLLREIATFNQVRDAGLEALSKLTSREREVLGLMARGADRDSVAKALTISRETARTHIQNVLRKLNVHTQLEAVAFVHSHHVAEQLDTFGSGPTAASGPSVSGVQFER